MRRLLVLTALLAQLALATPALAAPGGLDPTPAREAVRRLLPGHADQVILRTAAPGPDGDWFELSGEDGRIRLSGTSPAVLLTGLGWYLHHVAHADLGLPGESTEALPAVLPAPPAPAHRSASVAHRFALNDTDAGYSGAYRDWAALEHEVDLLALHGVNEVYVQLGAELPYYRALQEFGYQPAELRTWLPAPAHQPWWLLQNMSGFGGPVSDQLITARAELGARLVQRIRELGMTPVLPGYYGTVPPGFADRNPGARVLPQGTWCGFDRPDWLDPSGPVFADLAAAYYRYQQEEFGPGTRYKMDLLHEGGRATGVEVGAAARGVLAALRAAHPEAVWVLLGWEQNPDPAVLDAVDHRALFVLDGLADRYDGLDRERDWHGVPYAFGTIHDFGGHTALGANTAVWADRFRPGGALDGLAYLPEATGTDPAAFALFTELAWAPAPVDLPGWYAEYAAARYGGSDPHAAAAWDWLRRGPYQLPSGRWSEPQDGLFTARPSLTATNSATWSPPSLRYDPATVRSALAELLRVDPARRTTEAYRHDLVDLARQALADHSRALLPAVRTAYQDADLPAFHRLTTDWLAALDLLDRLTGTRAEFMLGPWLASARAWGADPAEQDQLEYDARSLLTTWGGRAAAEEGGVHDYAAREWSGLLSGLYAPRWQRYFATLETALTTGRPPEPVDWFAVDDAWAHAHAPYPTTPTGDAYQLATEVSELLPPD
ncbi:alpha-N-acetylglucosaminidase [Kitasatospora sp. MMS16-BH015]|uniref:alpha-N-acetylglucosaminidase n=1 Tax=Kitasatospora sp. MMS16-BH015 TaxID=2018025 RepID=UPI000CA29895|nr:alpha-N-acetylglucosaminidase [Kitasatospora sp. MMS16-BH015]AUG75134.1 alpha-N-acetylglucosaminidase [Kitasatospora sp. MMS16-BH015]